CSGAIEELGNRWEYAPTGRRAAVLRRCVDRTRLVACCLDAGAMGLPRDLGFNAGWLASGRERGRNAVVSCVRRLLSADRYRAATGGASVPCILRGLQSHEPRANHTLAVRSRSWLCPVFAAGRRLARPSG